MSRGLRMHSVVGRLGTAVLLGVLALLSSACGPVTNACGPSSATVKDVHDGDTITLDTGQKVRYLMVDTPEVAPEMECYGAEARDFNTQLVLGQKVDLKYDVQCTDRYGRLLAYVYLNGREVNSLLLERGYACMLHISPNGDDRVDEFQSIEDDAKSNNRGLWGFCSIRPC